MKVHFLATVASAMLFGGPALATDRGEIGYVPGSLGYDALIDRDYITAEAQLRARKGVAKNDPARLINLGHVMARTGRLREAERLFERAGQMDETELILADGRRMSSWEAADLARRSLKNSALVTR